VTKRGTPGTLSEEIRWALKDDPRPLTDRSIDRAADFLATAEDMGFISRKSKRVPAQKFFRHYILNLILHGRI